MQHAHAPHPPAPQRPASLFCGHILLGGLILACLGTEMVLLGADWQLWGSMRWRPLTYQYGAFWAGLLRDWQPNYAGQPAAMFFTYSFLHAGPQHLAGNMLGLAVLGYALLVRKGPRALALLWALSSVAGGLAFAVLAPGPAPMVGTSGVIFGLAGAWVVCDRTDRIRAGRRDRSLWMVLGLVGLNMAMWVVQDGQLAWQAHLGGVVAGMAFTWPYREKTRS